MSRIDANSPQQAFKPQHLHHPFSRTGGGQDWAKVPARELKLESTASPEDQVEEDSDAQFGRRKETGKKRDAGMGKVAGDLAEEARGTIENCLAK